MKFQYFKYNSVPDVADLKLLKYSKSRYAPRRGCLEILNFRHALEKDKHHCLKISSRAVRQNAGPTDRQQRCSL